MVQQIYRLPKVLEVTGLGRSSLYVEINAGRFPEPILLSRKSVGWLEQDIENWQQKVAQNRGRGLPVRKSAP